MYSLFEYALQVTDNETLVNDCLFDELFNEQISFLGLIENELSSLFSASHLVDKISIYIPLDLERYLLPIPSLFRHYLCFLTRFEDKHHSACHSHFKNCIKEFSFNLLS